MLNRYPLWKYILIVVVLLIGILYAVPNLYGEDPAVQVSAGRGAQIDQAALDHVETLLKQAQVPYRTARLVQDGDQVQVRFGDVETQLKAADVLRNHLGTNYTEAINMVPAAPAWMRDINAQPMYLGLDLRGGLHFLMQVDMNAAVGQAIEGYASDIRTLLREQHVRYREVSQQKDAVRLRFAEAAERDSAEQAVSKEYGGDLQLDSQDSGDAHLLVARLRPKAVQDIKTGALQQNITTLRKRVNELGVAEPVIQQQGQDRIVVELPGIQDSARAKDILGATATLEFRLVDTEHDVQAAVQGHPPASSRLYHDRQGRPLLLKRRVIITGEQINNASSGFDKTSGSPAVFVNLDSSGARTMARTTEANLHKPMAVVFIEQKSKTHEENGKQVTTTRNIEEVINVATIQGVFSKRFQITGLDDPDEAADLALLLRAGSLAAPMRIVEERTIGPSLGQDNIDKGLRSVVLGFIVVVAFMAIWYRGFGLIANLALAANVVLIVAVLSMLQATLTLPGIAGIVLTVGMAVDANVLIFERIREELRNGNSPQSSIAAGYDRALQTIADANITTLIAAVVLYAFGTGPIKGFAITLSIGILTSMFTAIMGTRAVVNLWIGGRRIKKLSI